MIADSPERTDFEGTRWKAVRLGLRLANSHVGVLALARFYLIWGLIGLILCVVFIQFAVLGKTRAFEAALNPVALYGYVLPIALMAVATWAVNLFSRLLWCGIPKPLTAILLAYTTVVGRVSVFFALGSAYLSGGPFAKGLLLPVTLGCSGIAWLGLVSEWRFIRILRRDFIPTRDPAQLSEAFDNTADDPIEAKDTTEENTKGVLTRDLGAWFKGRFPRWHKLASWILLPAAYVVVCWLNDDGNLQAIPDAMLRLAVITPAVLHIFWIPGDAIDELINSFSPRTAQENFDPT